MTVFTITVYSNGKSMLNLYILRVSMVQIDVSNLKFYNFQKLVKNARVT